MPAALTGSSTKRMAARSARPAASLRLDVVSFGLLSWSMRTLPLGTAYTIWTGIGAVGAFLVGIIVLGEAADLMRIMAAVLIVSGLMLMKLSSQA